MHVGWGGRDEVKLSTKSEVNECIEGGRKFSAKKRGGGVCILGAGEKKKGGVKNKGGTPTKETITNKEAPKILLM